MYTLYSEGYLLLWDHQFECYGEGREMKASSMAGHLIRRLNQLSTQIFTRRMQEAGFEITSVQFASLEAISTHPGIDQAGVAACIFYDRATIGGVIDRLVHKGYVTRSVSKKDRRARELRLTDIGKNAFDESLPIVADLQREILAKLSQAERFAFQDLASKAIGA